MDWIFRLVALAIYLAVMAVIVIGLNWFFRDLLPREVSLPLAAFIGGGVLGAWVGYELARKEAGHTPVWTEFRWPFLVAHPLRWTDEKTGYRHGRVVRAIRAAAAYWFYVLLPGMIVLLGIGRGLFILITGR